MEITLSPTWKQHLAYQALNESPEAEEILLGGGAGGGKSWFICESRLDKCLRFPGYKSFIGREELTRLMQSTFLTWGKVCSFHKIDPKTWKLNGQYHYIEFVNGSRVDFLDLKFLPTDPFYERLGSLEYTDGAIEEGGEVNFGAYDVLKSRVNRHLNKEYGIKPTLLITANPKKNWINELFYKPWKDGILSKDKVFIQSLWYDNEHTAESYGKQLAKISDPVIRQRLKEGNWEYDDAPNALIPYQTIIDMFQIATDDVSTKSLVIDAARLGGDKIVYNFFKGLRSYKIAYSERQTIDKTIQEARDFAITEGIPYNRIVVDEDGVGGGIVDGMPGVKGFVANRTAIPQKMDGMTGKPIPENYASLKDQCGYLLADLVNKRKVAIDPLDQKIKDLIVTEFEQLQTWKADSDKKLRLMPKDEIKKNIGRSPDFLDTFIMRMYLEVDQTPVNTTAAEQQGQFIRRQASQSLNSTR